MTLKPADARTGWKITRLIGNQGDESIIVYKIAHLTVLSAYEKEVEQIN